MPTRSAEVTCFFSTGREQSISTPVFAAVGAGFCFETDRSIVFSLGSRTTRERTLLLAEVSSRRNAGVWACDRRMTHFRRLMFRLPCTLGLDPCPEDALSGEVVADSLLIGDVATDEFGDSSAVRGIAEDFCSVPLEPMMTYAAVTPRTVQWNFPASY